MEKETSWNVTSNRFVAFLDIMGFKNMVNREAHQEILQKMLTFHEPIAIINEDSETRLLEKIDTIKNNDEPFTRVVTFSDSIILVTNDGTERSGFNICIALDWVMKNAITMGIPIKGAIAYGKQTSDFDLNLHFGRPLIDAFELEQEILLYGLVFHHTAEKHLNNSNFIYNMSKLGHIIKYPVNTKHGEINHYVLNWTSNLSIDSEIDISAIYEMYTQVSGQPRLYLDNTIRYFNTVKRIEQELDTTNSPDNV